jgi:hypothetical protein
MKKLHEIWRVKEGSKTLWKLQAPKGVITFNRKKDIIKWLNAITK